MEITSLMRLDRYVLRSLNIETHFPEGKREPADNGKCSLSLSPAIRKRKDALAFWVSLRVEVAWPQASLAPFKSISIALDGFFSFPKGTLESTANKFVPVLCMTNLYGIARGIVSQATGICEGGPFVLPLVDMNAALKESVKATQKKKAIKRTKRQPIDS